MPQGLSVVGSLPEDLVSGPTLQLSVVCKSSFRGLDTFTQTQQQCIEKTKINHWKQEEKASDCPVSSLVKALPTKSDDMRPVPGTHMAGQNRLLQVVL